MSKRTRGAVLLALLSSTPALAQAPRITPAGDPSVRADTIYRLAVDSTQFPEEASVLLLDDGVLRYEADGTGSTTYRQIVQILKESAAANYREFSFSYEPAHQKLTLNWIRVVKPDGEVISDKPAHLQESDVPAAMQSPVYTDRHVIRASVSGVEPGTIVDYSYTLEELKPYRSGDFLDGWFVNSGQQVKRSRYIVDLPASMHPRLVETNLDFARKSYVRKGRRVYEWITANVPRVQPEPLAADSNDVLMSVRLAGPGTWEQIGSWYAGLARDRYAITPTVDAKLKEVVAKAKTREDTIRAVQRWVSQDISYISIDLGIGGYQPRAPETVVSTGFGDCKDKATLFVASLNHLGIPAFPVLLSSTGGVDRRLPSIDQFDHAIAAVKTAQGYTFTDLTADLTPYGQLPPAEQGGFALVVHPDGATEEVTLPQDSIGANQLATVISGELLPDGTFRGSFDERASGSQQYTLRNAFAQPLSEEQRKSLLRSVAGNLYPGAVGDSLEAFDGKDPLAAPHVSLDVSGGQAAKHSGDTWVLTLPFENMASLTNAIAELKAHSPRRFTIDAAAVMGPRVTVHEFRVLLPPGWKAHLPKSVKASSPFGSYSSEYVQEGRELRVTRRTEGARGVFAPDRLGELIAWYGAMAEDDAQFILLDSGSGGK
jgi:transglutaminase-like putative cysteine protease